MQHNAFLSFILDILFILMKGGFFKRAIFGRKNIRNRIVEIDFAVLIPSRPINSLAIGPWGVGQIANAHTLTPKLSQCLVHYIGSPSCGLVGPQGNNNNQINLSFLVRLDCKSNHILNLVGLPTACLSNSQYYWCHLHVRLDCSSMYGICVRG